MRSRQILVRKIEKLERRAEQKCLSAEKHFATAVRVFEQSCSNSSFESLISAFGAERKGRRLTEAEAAAMQEYWSYVRRECQWAQVPLPTRCPPEIGLRYALLIAFAACGDWDFGSRGHDASGEGREPSKDEREAMERLDAVNARVAELAGFDSLVEFNQFVGDGGGK